MFEILNVVLPTFIVILIGYILGKVAKWNMASIVDIVIYIGLPALTFTSMLDKKIVFLDATKVWAAALMIMLGCGITAWIVFKLIKQQHSGLYITILLMNTVNIPFPIIYLVYGSQGLFAATLFYIPNVILMYSLGVFLASGKHWREGVKEIFKVPPIYAAVFGLILNLTNITVPKLVIQPLSLIGQMTIPLALIVLGNNLSRVRITSVPTTLLASFLRVGVGLLLGLLAANIFHLTGVIRAVVILDSAMPSAVNAFIIATKYKSEPELVSSVVFVTTLMSLAIIPFLLFMLA